MGGGYGDKGTMGLWGLGQAQILGPQESTCNLWASRNSLEVRTVGAVLMLGGVRSLGMWNPASRQDPRRLTWPGGRAGACVYVSQLSLDLWVSV